MNLLWEVTPTLTLSVSHLALIVSGWKIGLCPLWRYLPRLPSPTFCFHYRFLFIWTKAFCLETEGLCKNLVGLSVPIFSLASDAGKLCLCSQGPFVFCCVLGVCLVGWRCVPLSCRLTCTHFKELFCTALCWNVLPATAITLGVHVCVVQKGAWVTRTKYVYIVCVWDQALWSMSLLAWGCAQVGRMGFYWGTVWNRGGYKLI